MIRGDLDALAGLLATATGEAGATTDKLGELAVTAAVPATAGILTVMNRNRVRAKLWEAPGANASDGRQPSLDV